MFMHYSLARINRSRHFRNARLQLEPLEERRLLTATPVSYLGDLYDDNVSSNPQGFTEMNGLAYFSAGGDGGNAGELWRSDGTEEGTKLVKDIYPNVGLVKNGSFPHDFVNVNGTLYFRATDPENGAELWKSDGTSGGTKLVKDINPGPNSHTGGFGSISSTMVTMGGKLFFSARDETHGFELWKSDGTLEGTQMVEDLSSGSSFPKELTVIGNTLYFFASGTAGVGLWKTDGDGQTELVKSLEIANGGGTELTAIGNMLYFSGYTAFTGAELWQSDGTPLETKMIADLHSNLGGDDHGSNPRHLTNVGGKLYFTADDGSHGTELWMHDPDPEVVNPTKMVANINGNDDDVGGPVSSDPNYLTNFNGALYFSAGAGVNDIELWTTDGTTTTRVADIDPGLGGSNPSDLTVVNDKLFFSATNSDNERRLWAYQPGVVGAPFDSDLVMAVGSNYLANINGTLFFQAYVNNGLPQDTLWVAGPSLKSSVRGRHLFYNESGTSTLYDHNDPAINSFDDLAIATDKTAYLWEDAGAATFANVSSYDKGINGIMIDLAGAGGHESITASDFIFRVGNNNAPSTWSTAPPPTSISVRTAEGENNADRIEITWANGAIANEWLEVIVLANSHTGLAQKVGYPAGQGDAFFFGNAIGNTGVGDSVVNSLVNILDGYGIRSNPAFLFTNIPITNIYDVNRDAAVNSTDESIARLNGTNPTTALKYLNLTNSPAAPEAAPLTAADDTADSYMASALTAPALASSPSGAHVANGSRSRVIPQKFNSIEGDSELDEDLLDSLIAGFSAGQ